MEQLFISAYLLQKRQTPKLYLIKYVRESIYDKPKPKKDSVCWRWFQHFRSSVHDFRGFWWFGTSRCEVLLTQALSVLTLWDSTVGVSNLERVLYSARDGQTARRVSLPSPPHWISALSPPTFPGISSALLGTRGVPKTILTITGTTLGFSGLEAKPREKISRALSRGLWSESDPTINVDWLAMTPMTPQTPQLAPLHRPYFPTKPV